ncbi:hypothetical protein FACS189426_23380 [Bacteroidia bacterium]|nr:hypothetical protein FACS189426_23380 [Bacteroidia bacterium]GHT87014.1 hypothetical protein FACS18947_7090 [Bacteroidia bacterium]
MKTFNLQEMSLEEMQLVEGGCIACKIVKAVGEVLKDAIDAAVEWVEDQLH